MLGSGGVAFLNVAPQAESNRRIINQRHRSKRSILLHGSGILFREARTRETCRTSPPLASTTVLLTQDLDVGRPRGVGAPFRRPGWPCRIGPASSFIAHFKHMHTILCIYNHMLGTSSGDAGLGGSVPFAHLTGSAPRTKSIFPPEAKTSSQVSQALSQGSSFTLTLCT